MASALPRLHLVARSVVYRSRFLVHGWIVLDPSAVRCVPDFLVGWVALCHLVVQVWFVRPVGRFGLVRLAGPVAVDLPVAAEVFDLQVSVGRYFVPVFDPRVAALVALAVVRIVAPVVGSVAALGWVWFFVAYCLVRSMAVWPFVRQASLPWPVAPALCSDLF